MGLTKSELFTDEQNELAGLAKALAHPARIAIIQHLLKADQCINSDLVDELGLAQPTVSQHLKALKETGFIKGSIEGTSMCYCIDSERWKEVRTMMMRLFDQYQNSAGLPDNGCC